MIVLDEAHHEAFDRGLFTIDERYRPYVVSEFSTESDVLEETLLDRKGERVGFHESRSPSTDYLREHKATLDWW